MITGFNTDVDYDGRVFHVQTEDKGVQNPMVESLVYSGGEIVTSRRSSYAEILGTPAFSEAEVLKRMERQHQALIQEVVAGRLDPDGPKPFGYNIITNRSFDQVVREYLSGDASLEPIRLELEGHPTLVEGSRPTVKLRVVSEGSDAPVAGARVTVKLISTMEKPKELFSGTTEQDGRLAADLDLPALPGANAALLCQAESEGRNAEVKQLVLKPEDKKR
jgi:hypothetical protein